MGWGLLDDPRLLPWAVRCHSRCRAHRTPECGWGPPDGKGSPLGARAGPARWSHVCRPTQHLGLIDVHINAVSPPRASGGEIGKSFPIRSVFMSATG